jgi:hypothetical protein
MFHINHNDAIELEHHVKRLYKCDRGGISGLAEAGYFESKPIQAAVLVVAYIYAKYPDTEALAYDEFVNKYENIFVYPDENDAKNEVKNYISDLKEIVESYIYQ